MVSLSDVSAPWLAFQNPESNVFRNTSNRGYVAWLCTLSPNNQIDPAEVLKLARADYEAENNVGLDCCIPHLRASLYRAGQFQRAVDLLEPMVTRLNQGGGDSTDRYELARSQYFLAIARHQLGHAFQARRYLKEASRQVEWVMEREVSGSMKYRERWTLQVELATLQRDAMSLIDD